MAATTHRTTMKAELWGLDLQWTVTTMIAVAALAHSIWSNRRRDRQAAREKEQAAAPLVEASASRVRDQPAWHLVRLSIENRAPYDLRADALRVRAPRQARLLRFGDGSVENTEPWKSRPIRNPLPVEAAARAIAFKNRRFDRAREGRTRHHIDVFLWLPLSPGAASSVSLSLEYSTIEAISRRKRLSIALIVSESTSSVTE